MHKMQNVAQNSHNFWRKTVVPAEQLLFKRIFNNKLNILQPLLEKLTSHTYALADKQLTMKTVHINNSSFIIRLAVVQKLLLNSKHLSLQNNRCDLSTDFFTDILYDMVMFFTEKETLTRFQSCITRRN